MGKFGAKSLGHLEIIGTRSSFAQTLNMNPDWAHLLDNEYLLLSVHVTLILFTKLSFQGHRDFESGLINLHVARLGLKKVDKVRLH